MNNADLLRKNYSAWLSSQNSKIVGTLETSVSNHAVPRFSIYDTSGKKVKTLIACFIQRIKFTRESVPSQILADDGLVYNAVYDCRIPNREGPIEFIVSFQKHTYGRFAIIRLASPRFSGKQ